MDKREIESDRIKPFMLILRSPAYKFSGKGSFHVFLILLLADTHIDHKEKKEEWKVLQDNKRCHTMIMSKNAVTRKDASMLVCSRCVAAFAVLRLASAAWRVSVVVAPKMWESVE
ncbi:uncharacterized protein LOC132187965 [Corylus avellana]|uniref:uncharacterized protein LOC132187965 n=1 Tax=Corylus avellana TaxID=13451 RepID=UPI00286CA572|nr:uncharacterized protein LOC132187965 [Corylus avellana]